MLAELFQLGLKAEGTEGTFSAPGAADAKTLVRNLKHEWINPKDPRNTRSSSFSKQPPINRQAGGKLSFEFDLYSSGQSALPSWATIVASCGFAATSGGTSAAWLIKLLSANASTPSASMSFYEDGYLRKLAGCRGNLKIVAKAGRQLTAQCEFMGVHVDAADASFLSPTYDTNADDLPPFQTAAVALTHHASSSSTDDLTSSECILENFELDLGNTLFLRPSANAAMGFLSCQITNRAPTVTIDPEMTTVAVFDWLKNCRSDFPYIITTGQLNGYATKNNIKLDMPKCFFAGWSEENRGGIAVSKPQFTCQRDAADNDEVLITLAT